MKIDVLGSGSAFSLARNTSALLVTHQQQRWMIDCGPTIPRALWQRQLDKEDIDVMYFTHIHPDHCAGLPAVLNRWKSFGRKKPLQIYCQAAHRPVLKQLAALATWPQTHICFDIEWLDTRSQWSWHDWRIRTAPTQHEMTNLAIRIDVEDQSLFYSGDGRPTQESINLMHGAQLAFQECAVHKALPNDASHGDLAGCLALANVMKDTLLGLYHCYDEEIPALTHTSADVDNVFMSYDGLHMDLASGTQALKDTVLQKGSL